jgi:hypothetical protein
VGPERVLVGLLHPAQNALALPIAALGSTLLSDLLCPLSSDLGILVHLYVLFLSGL